MDEYERGYSQGMIQGKVDYRCAVKNLLISLNKMGVMSIKTERLIELLEHIENS